MPIAADYIDPNWTCHFVQSVLGDWCGFAGKPIPAGKEPKDRKRLHTPWMPTEQAARDMLFALLAASA